MNDTRGQSPIDGVINSWIYLRMISGLKREGLSYELVHKYIELLAEMRREEMNHVNGLRALRACS